MIVVGPYVMSDTVNLDMLELSYIFQILHDAFNNQVQLINSSDTLQELMFVCPSFSF